MPRHPMHEPLYQAMERFRQDCLLADRSLLWPEREIWTIANLEEVRRRFVEGFIQGRMTFRSKLAAQLSGAPPDAWALLADCFYIYGLPTRTLRTATKLGWVEWAAAQAGLELPVGRVPEGAGRLEDPLWLPLQGGFAATGQKYNLKHAQLRLLILLALEVKDGAPINTPGELQTLLDRILESIPLKLDRANDLRNALLYLSFPDEYEPIISNQEKEAILRHYGRVLNLALPPDRDAALRQVRHALEGRFAGYDTELGRPFDFMLDLREEWRPAGRLEQALRQASAVLEPAVAEPAVTEPAVTEPAVAEPAETVQSPTSSTVYQPVAPGRLGLREADPSWPSGQDIVNDPDFQRALEALQLSRNLILSGPPGTGKTYLAEGLAQFLAGQDAPERVTWVTLHPSYAYEDFIEGLRPAINTSGTAYQVRPGVFREASRRAAADSAHTHVLVLDEINRANLGKILGELITLLEDDKRGRVSAQLPYSGERFSVPPNLVLIGTMNTADRSVALLDAALRRRFVFVELMPRPDLLGEVTVETEEAVLRLEDVLSCLNAAIRWQLGRDQQVGHSYFLRVARAAPAERLAMLELVWNNQVLPLLEEYFYTRRERLAEVLAPFLDDGAPHGGLAEDLKGSFGSDLTSAARLTGEDLLVALSRLCDGRAGGP